MKRVLVILVAIFIGACGASKEGPKGDKGDPGDNGADGSTVLIRLDEEEAGANCANGGTAVHAGIDVNDDGQLSEAEIQSTSYVCSGETPGQGSGVLEGSITVKNLLDVEFIAGYTEISGDLFVEAPGLQNIRLPLLTTVGRNLIIRGNDDEYDTLKSIELNGLISVGRVIEINSNAALTSLEINALASVERLEISNNCALASIEGINNLHTINGNLTINHNDIITSLRGLEKINTVGGDFRIIGNVSLTDIDALGGIITIGQGLLIQENTSLNSLAALGNLRRVNNVFQVISNTAL